MQKNTVYTVTAYRWGDTGNHSYIVGVYSKKDKALKEAENERNHRGGKYDCEVLEWDIDKTNEGKVTRNTMQGYIATTNKII